MPPPQRVRNTFDDSKSEASSSREKQPPQITNGISKARRSGASGSALKDVTNATQSTNEQQGTQEPVASVRNLIIPETHPLELTAKTRSTGPPSTPPYFMLTGRHTASIFLRPSSLPTIKECLRGLASGCGRPPWHDPKTADAWGKISWHWPCERTSMLPQRQSLILSLRFYILCRIKVAHSLSPVRSIALDANQLPPLDKSFRMRFDSFPTK